MFFISLPRRTEAVVLVCMQSPCFRLAHLSEPLVENNPEMCSLWGSGLEGCTRQVPHDVGCRCGVGGWKSSGPGLLLNPKRGTSSGLCPICENAYPRHERAQKNDERKFRLATQLPETGSA